MFGEGPAFEPRYLSELEPKSRVRAFDITCRDERARRISFRYCFEAIFVSFSISMNCELVSQSGPERAGVCSASVDWLAACVVPDMLAESKRCLGMAVFMKCERLRIFEVQLEVCRCVGRRST